MKVIFCVPTLKKPHQKCLDSLQASIPLIQEAGWDEGMVSEIGCPYISNARATMLKKALDVKADVIVFIDHDLAWDPEDLLTLIETKGDVVAGTYRFKHEPEEYMGTLLSGEDGTPLVREDGCLQSFSAPAGFLKITKGAVNKIIESYPELLYGDRYSPHIDIFQHGAHNFIWYGEDYAFCRRWIDCGGEIWTIPNLNIDHYCGDVAYKGNLHNFLIKQPGGSGA